MQRDNAAHLPAVPDTNGPANDTRDSPLNSLLRKQSPAPEAPASKPLATAASAPDVPAGKALITQASAPESIVARPLAAQVSPAEMLVNKLEGKQSPARDTPSNKPLAAQAAAPETPIGKPIDVDYAPVEAPVSEPPPAQDIVPEPPAAKPLDMRGPVLETSLSQVPPKRTATPEPAAKPLSTQGSVTPVAKPLDAQGSVLETSIDPLLPKRESIPETPVAKPPRVQDRAPEIPVGRSLRTQETAREKSVGKLLALPRRTRDEREFLPAALEIVDTPPSPVGRAVGFTIILVAVLAIAWACIGKVDIVATASGRIVPQGKTKIVQPADTGIVTAIHVADGDHVKAGDVLIELNSTQVMADRDRFQRDLLQANLNLARLRGLAATLPGTPGEGRRPDLVDPPKDAKPEDLALTLAAMRAQAANENAKLADLDQQIEAKQAEAAEATAAAEKLQASLPMVADQEKLLRAMRDQKIGSKLDWYQVNQQLIEQQHEIGVLSHRKDAAEAAQRALREQRAAEAAQYQMQVLADLDKMRAQASELEAELAKAEQRTSQGVLHAPIAGTVQQLAVHTIGGVVTPAESLLAIVPTEGSLIVEAAVQNRDVGFISAGQTVRVKVEAFNFTLYGLIDGQVIDVTRDAVSNPANDKKGGKAGDQNVGDPAASDGNSGPVYLARIALSQDWMMTENGKVDLTPGMAVTAEIQTGERRLISYLLSPLVRHVSESMHER